jgi:Protein of unknown function (DUF3641)
VSYGTPFISYLETPAQFYADAAKTPQLELCCVTAPPLQSPSLNVPDIMHQMNYGYGFTPDQGQLEQNYKTFLKEQFGISFSHLFTITNLPVGRTGQYLQRQRLYQPYVQFLADHFNPLTVDGLMCRNALSVDYRGYIYDCDFNQMAEIPTQTATGEPLTVAKLLAAGSLDLIMRFRRHPIVTAVRQVVGRAAVGL